VDPGAGEIRETPRQHADRIARPFGFRDLLLGEVCRRPAALARRTGRCLAPPCRRGEREVELPVGTGQTSEPVVVNKLGDVGLAVGCVVGDAIGARSKDGFHSDVLCDSFFAVEEEGGAATAVTGVTNVAVEINIGNGICMTGLSRSRMLRGARNGLLGPQQPAG
jgi:hypothetical protein